MPTATAPLTREDILRTGLTGATGTVTLWDAARNYGFVKLHGEAAIDLFVPGALLPRSDRKQIMSGSQLAFDLAPGQPDVKKPKPRVSNPRLILPAAA